MESKCEIFYKPIPTEHNLATVCSQLTPTHYVAINKITHMYFQSHDLLKPI